MAKTTPCDFGECPYDAQYSEACRVYCGLGVDEDSYEDDEEEYIPSSTYENYSLSEDIIMKKFNCPECGKELIRLEPFEKGIYDFWCDNCDVDITVTKNDEVETEN